MKSSSLASPPEGGELSVCLFVKLEDWKQMFCVLESIQLCRLCLSFQDLFGRMVYYVHTFTYKSNMEMSGYISEYICNFVDMSGYVTNYNLM